MTNCSLIGRSIKPASKPRGGDTPLYELYRYVPLGRVWFSSSLVWDRV